MEYNKNLSAIVRHRNKQGLSGNVTSLGFLVRNPDNHHKMF